MKTIRLLRDIASDNVVIMFEQTPSIKDLDFNESVKMQTTQQTIFQIRFDGLNNEQVSFLKTFLGAWEREE